MLSAKKMSEAFQHFGVKVISYEESRKPEYIDGEVILGNSLSVQVGTDYACLCFVGDNDIEYLLEMEEVFREVDFATEVVKFLKNNSISEGQPN